MAIAVALGLLVLGAIILHRTVRPPAWYRPATAADAAAVVLGERVEYRMAEELQRVRPPAETWALRLTEDQANAWLATRLPGWYRGATGRAWPAEVGLPQVRVDAGQLAVVIGVDLAGVDTGLGMRVRPISADMGGPGRDAGGAGAARGAGVDGPDDAGPPLGLARLGLAAGPLQIGRLPGAPDVALGGLADGLARFGLASADVQSAVRDPASWLDAAIERLVRETAAGEDAMAGPGPGVPIRLADGRRVRLTAVGLEPAAITLSFTAAAGGSAPR